MVVVSNARFRCDDPSIDLDLVDAIRVGYSRGHVRNTVNSVDWVVDHLNMAARYFAVRRGSVTWDKP